MESKESVKIEEETQTYATITIQNYFRLYTKLAGMTGTAETEQAEFFDIYKLGVLVIPSNRPCLRQDNDDSIYLTEKVKFKSVVEEVRRLNAEGRPVLVGTVAVETSEHISRLLEKSRIPHSVLNAKFHEQEAEIVARAGQRGTVTIATNMAGLLASPPDAASPRSGRELVARKVARVVWMGGGYPPRPDRQRRPGRGARGRP